MLAPNVTPYFVPIRSSQPTGNRLVYQPAVLGAGQIHFGDVTTGADITKDLAFTTQITDDPIPVNWDNAVEFVVSVSDLEANPTSSAQYAELPATAGKAKSYDTWGKDFANWLYRTQKMDLWKSPGLKETSKPGEAERDFRVRLQQKAREQRDDESERLKQKYATKMTSLQEQVRRAQMAVDREAAQAKQARMQTALSVGATLLGAFVGRKAVSYSTLSRGTTAARGVGRAMQQSQDVGRAKDNVAALEERLRQLEADFKAEADVLAAKLDPLTETLQQIALKPAKKDISVRLVALTWLPHWQSPDGKLTPAW
jgi:hypothetical protein